MTRWELNDKIPTVLVGQRIKAIYVNSETLHIVTDKAVHKFEVEGDCCSHSYFYEVQNVSQMISWVAKEIEKIGMPNPEQPDEYGLLQAYGYKIHTEGGYGLIVFRNSSNGYYGGWMHYLGTVEDGYISGTELREDWNG
jgi:hypothetical protein